MSRSNLVATFLDFCAFCTSTVAVCISTCSSEDSKVCSVTCSSGDRKVCYVATVADKGSVTKCATSEDFSNGNFLMHRLLW